MIDKLKLKNGKWIVANCGKFPSEKNCQLVLMAPEEQRDDLLDAVVNHAVKFHGHADNNELRNQLNTILETIDL